MTSLKNVEWKSKDGRAVKVIIEVTRKMVEDVAYADGWNLDLGKKPHESTKITLTLNDKVIDTVGYVSVINEQLYTAKDMATIRANNGYAKLGNAIINKEQYDNIMAAVAEATTEAEQDEEYKAHLEAKNQAKAVAEAAQKELEEEVIPEVVVDLYNKYGCEEKAWGDGSDEGWALLSKWMPYLEAQYGMSKEKAARLFGEAVREANFGINES